MKRWTSPVYAFYEPIPDIAYVDGRRVHIFKCTARSCRYTCRRFLDGLDRSSTGNLIKHVKTCWGDDAYRAAAGCMNAKDARENVVKSFATKGSITTSFKRAGKGKVTYMHRQYTKTETKYLSNYLTRPYLICCSRTEIVRWVAESMRPFKIVEDRGFLSLMKTGRPEY